MRRTFEVIGFFGSDSPATILVLERRDDSYWYCVQGSDTVFQTWDPIEEGVQTETLEDFDMISCGVPIPDLEALVEVVNDYCRIPVRY
jgi:hypothetical protein